jgi:hypothetical protein
MHTAITGEEGARFLVFRVHDEAFDARTRNSGNGVPA